MLPVSIYYVYSSRFSEEPLREIAFLKVCNGLNKMLKVVKGRSHYADLRVRVWCERRLTVFNEFDYMRVYPHSFVTACCTEQSFK